ncbi:MAG: universal stress protein [Devosia sp.]|nr:universal stress protein [Devosia sp.]
MYSRILVAIDGSDLAKKGLDQGLALAKALGSSVTVVTVSEPWTPMGVDAAGLAVTEYALADEYEKAAEIAGKDILAKAGQAAEAAGVPCQTVYLPRKYPADGIVEYAASSNTDLIVMASHGRRGIQRVLLGSQALQVLTNSKVPVLIVR